MISVPLPNLLYPFPVSSLRHSSRYGGMVVITDQGNIVRGIVRIELECGHALHVARTRATPLIEPPAYFTCGHCERIEP